MKKIEELINLENELIISQISSINSESLDNSFINEIVEQKHREIIGYLFWKYISSRCPELSFDTIKSLINIDIVVSNIQVELSIDEIPLICEQLHVIYLNSKFSIKNNKLTRGKSKANLIEKGAVYTKPNIAQSIVARTLSICDSIDNNFSILDFACGTGRFYDAIVLELSKLGIPAKRSILNNIFAVDLDDVAINITRLKAISYLDEINFEDIKEICSHIIVRNVLVRNNENNCISNSDFNGRIMCGFDAIVSNPPYLVLKPNKKKLESESGKRLMQLVSYFRNSSFYNYSLEGMLNLYQLSIEAMLSMLKSKGALGVICPSTLFADISATKLRKHLLNSNKISSISFYGEDSQLFENVLQATCIFHLKKDCKTETIEIQSNEKSFSVELSVIQELFPKNLEIPIIQKCEWKILSKMLKLKKLKDLTSVRNKRGELDLTLCARFITTNPTQFRLIRGNMIGANEIRKGNNEYVLEDFIATKSQDFIINDFKKKRLICQQISNANQSKRLKFIFCETNDILGNSCNYLSSDEVTLKKLQLILNSNILNWRFKITSSNNHINNYELAELPIVELSSVDENFTYNTQEELDSYIGKLYGLTKKEIKIITQ